MSMAVARLPALARGWCVSGVPLSPKKRSEIAATDDLAALPASVEATRERQAATYIECGRLSVRGRGPGRNSPLPDTTPFGVLTRERGTAAVLGGYKDMPGNPMTGDQIRAVLAPFLELEMRDFSVRRNVAAHLMKVSQANSKAPQDEVRTKKLAGITI
ncbi:MAG: hypothetical protein VR70_11080 [Rhodospirillaceae bacterium BRH_c57]|nr:MAG: hypothetical protein VR70_11080 [Rhodospirillaceae bacterium BRH_c57]